MCTKWEPTIKDLTMQKVENFSIPIKELNLPPNINCLSMFGYCGVGNEHVPGKMCNYIFLSHSCAVS